MVVSAIQLYEILSAKLGKEEAKALTEYVETKVEKQLNEKSNVYATKQDLHEVEIRLTRNIFITGVVQFPAIVGSVLML